MAPLARVDPRREEDAAIRAALDPARTPEERALVERVIAERARNGARYYPQRT